ncbi:glycosyltransferase family 2 protein [Parasphingorhabdus pacifica]
MTGAPGTSVVIATRNRCPELLRTLAKLHELAPPPPVIVVDNASDDGTPAAVAERFPRVSLIRLQRNLGAVARNIGCLGASTPYVAFCDDDSWWEPKALTIAETAFADNPGVGLIAARTLVGEQRRPDPVNEPMANSPLTTPPELPGRRVLGFTACSAIVRRSAFAGVDGFNPVLFFVAEEKMLAWDLATHGWDLIYLDAVVARHHPSDRRSGTDRRALLEQRNNLLLSWMRRSPDVAVQHTRRVARAALTDRNARGAFSQALLRAPAALLRRRRLPAPVEREVELLEADQRSVRRDV